jgi:hypothetical protein
MSTAARDVEAELRAAQPVPPDPNGFNPRAELPYGLTTEQLYAAMVRFTRFLGFVDTELIRREMTRLPALMMPAGFSSLVGEFMVTELPRDCAGLAKNQYHNGHPDLLPKGMFPRDEAQHEPEGIEVKGSRYPRGWQGHNAESCWLMVFAYDANRPRDANEGEPPRPFRYLKVMGARLDKGIDWVFSGRSETSRRTITASVTRSGYEKMNANWIYRVPDADRILRAANRKRRRDPAGA